jgi:hypothetical protein
MPAVCGNQANLQKLRKDYDMRYRKMVCIALTILIISAVSACGAVTPVAPSTAEPEEALPISNPLSLTTPEDEDLSTEEATVAPEAGGENLEEATPPPQATPEPASVAEFRDLEPTRFTDSTTIDNPWMPLTPGTRWVHEGTALDDEGNTVGRRIEFTVTDLTKEIAGVKTVVVWIVDYDDDGVVEKELAFYAQDQDGDVWYLGEYPEEFEDGEFVKASPWIHGIEDARAGIKMLAAPEVGLPTYYQGWGPAVSWSDYSQIDQMGQETCVPVDCYTNVLVIAESSLGETDAYQLKYYASDIGEVRVGWRGEDLTHEELELVELLQLNPEELAEVHTLALKIDSHGFEVSPDVYGQTSPLE